MALTVDYSVFPHLITIPQSDLTLESGTKYKLTVDEFWLLLRDFTDEENTMAQPKLYRRIPATSSTPSITEIEEAYYVLEFEDGLYSVNIIEGNTNIRDVEVKNQVSVNTNNTTGFIDPVFLEYTTFDNHVTVDTVSGSAGTEYPLGTELAPSNNLTDAKAIAIKNGFKRIRIKDSTFNLTTGDDFDDFEIFGVGVGNITMTVDSGASVTNSRFEKMKIQGTLDGNNVLENVLMLNLNFVNGFVRDCLLGGTVVLGGGVQANLIDVSSGIAGEATPTIDFGGSGQSLIARGYEGGVTLINKTGADNASIDLASGQVRIDLTTVTNGTLVVRGPGKVVDDATGDWLPSGAYGSLTLINETMHGQLLSDVWTVLGLDKSNPMTVTPTSRVAGDVSQVISGNGETTTTVTRQ